MDRSALTGVVVVDKPCGLTSAQVVKEVRRRLGVEYAGHTGTLDPLATGVLPVCIGEACKAAGLLIAEDKAYEAELELGVETDTLDRTGEIVAERRDAAAAIDEPTLRAALARFVGPLQQLPPRYSAIKQGGRRLYHLARRGVEVERAPRDVFVQSLELRSFTPPRATLAIACSKGTFVRSLIDDLGRALGCGAHLTELRRTRSGPFDLADAVPLDHLPGPFRLIPIADALGLPRIEVPPPLLRAVWHAHPEPLADLVAPAPEGQRFQLVSGAGELLALCRREGTRLHFDRVFRVS